MSEFMSVTELFSPTLICPSPDSSFAGVLALTPSCESAGKPGKHSRESAGGWLLFCAGVAVGFRAQAKNSPEGATCAHRASLR